MKSVYLTYLWKHILKNNKDRIKINKFGHYSEGNYIFLMTSRYVSPFFHQ
jgi:hypothetical protein